MLPDLISKGDGPTISKGDAGTTWPVAVHEQAEYESAVSYAAGWRDGYAAAERALADEIRQTTGVELPDATAVIRWLVRGVGRVSQ